MTEATAQFQRALDALGKARKANDALECFSFLLRHDDTIKVALQHAIDDGSGLLATNQSQARIIGELRAEIEDLKAEVERWVDAQKEGR